MKRFATLLLAILACTALTSTVQAPKPQLRLFTGALSRAELKATAKELNDWFSKASILGELAMESTTKPDMVKAWKDLHDSIGAEMQKVEEGGYDLQTLIQAGNGLSAMMHGQYLLADMRNISDKPLLGSELSNKMKLHSIAGVPIKSRIDAHISAIAKWYKTVAGQPNW